MKDEDAMDMGEAFRDLRKERQEVHRQRRNSSAATLARLKVPFEWKNAGAHLIIRPADKPAIDFWPGTGLWVQRGGRKGRGFGPLMKFLGVQP